MGSSAVGADINNPAGTAMQDFGRTVERLAAQLDERPEKMKHVSAMFFAVAIMAGSAAASGVADYSINYNDYKCVPALGPNLSNCLPGYAWRENSFAIPPNRFLHAPAAGIPVTVTEVNKTDLVTKCGLRVYGCVKLGKDKAGTVKKADIFIPELGERIIRLRFNRSDQRAILVHEIAHINGWSANHER